MNLTETRGKWSNTITINSFDTDGENYEVLYDAAQRIVNIKGMTCEIGVRAGGSSKVIIDGIMASGPKGIRTHVAIDPYGSLDYKYNDTEVIADAYENKYRDIAIPALFRYCVNSKVNFQFYQMTDTQFMKRFADGVPVYLSGKEYLLNNYALVYFDGPHATEDVMNETVFFNERALKGSVFIYDDVSFYEHGKIENYLKKNRWKPIVGTSTKFSYTKDG